MSEFGSRIASVAQVGVNEAGEGDGGWDVDDTPVVPRVESVERLINLTMALMQAGHPLIRREIYERVDGYAQAGPIEVDLPARDRMFERDKAALRELGVPLVSTRVDSDDKASEAYAITRRDYTLPDLALEPDEAAVLGMAAQVWSSASLAAAGRLAAVKVAGSAGIEVAPPPWLEARIEGGESAFEPVRTALSTGMGLQFAYRGVKDLGAPGSAPLRDVDPWGLVSWRSRWYLVGHDRDRDAVRVFRLSRVEGQVALVKRPSSAPTVAMPTGYDYSETVRRFAEPEPRSVARVLVRAGRGWPLRASAVEIDVLPDGWSRLELPYAHLDSTADRLTGYGPDVVVEEPVELVAAVVRRLRALAGEGTR